MGEPEFTAANVENVTTLFYQSGSISGQHDWLNKAQNSPQAWQFAWDLLAEGKSAEIQFFGASTLANKVSKCFHEVPDTEFPALRERIINLLIGRTGHDSKIVTTRLCVAAASMVIHSMPALWSTPITDLIGGFQSQMEVKGLGSLTLLLELLTVIPEEFSTIVMSSGRRSEVRNELAKAVPEVLALNKKVLNEAGMPIEVIEQGIKSLQAWVQFGIDMTEMDSLVEKLLNCLKEEELFECTLDALCSMISHPVTHKFPNTIKTICKRIIPLDQHLFQLMHDNCHDEAAPLATLFITFGEIHSRLMLDWTQENEEGKQCSVRVVNAIFQISACSAQFPTQETLSEIAFGFWYIFQDDIIACEPQQYQQCIAVFGGFYHRLVEALLFKSMFLIDDSSWAADQHEAFRCYRIDVADTIMYCFNILRDNLLQILLSHLDQAITKMNMNSKDWPYLEACLHAWAAIGESIAEEEESESAFLTRFLAKLPIIPYHGNEKVISAALDCIGGFAEWLSSNPQLISQIIPIVISSLPNQELSLGATLALRDITRDCADSLRPFAKDVVTSCHSALSSNRLKNAECIRLMYPIGKMVSLMPQEEMINQLQVILTPYIQELQQIPSSEINPQNRSRVIYTLKLLASLFLPLNINHKENEEKAESQQAPKPIQPILILFPQLFPVIKGLAEKFIMDADIMESVWDFLKQCVSTLREEIRVHVQEILEFVITCYTTAPHASALELTHPVLTLFVKDPAFRPILVNVFSQINVTTLTYIQSTGNVSDHVDLVATYFQLMAHIARKDYKMFDPNGGIDLAQMFQCAYFCLNLAEASAVRCTTSFLSQLITVSGESPYLLALVNEQGDKLFKQVITCIGSINGRQYTEYYAEILLAMNKRYFENLCQWMNAFVQEQNFPSPHVTQEQKKKFAELVLRERANKRKLSEIICEFNLSCSGIKDRVN